MYMYISRIYKYLLNNFRNSCKDYVQGSLEDILERWSDIMSDGLAQAVGVGLHLVSDSVRHTLVQGLGTVGYRR